MSARLTLISSTSADAARKPVAVLVPGGPGLSASTLRSLDLLRRTFDLAYVDPPGTAGTPEPSNPTFASAVDAIETELKGFGRPVLLIGHSFGGAYASELIARGRVEVKGVVFLSVPLRRETYALAVSRFEKLRTPELDSAEQAWTANPNNDTFRTWLATYGTMYFHRDHIASGAELIQRDPASSHVFVKIAAEDILSKRSFSEDLVNSSLPKLMLAGKDDQLFPVEALRADAEAAKATFAAIDSASHFLMFDQPEAVVRQIETWFTGSSKEGVPR